MAKFSMTKQQFINQWLRHFAPGLSKDQFEKYVKGQYIWHVFSCDLIPCDGLLTGDEARRAFDEADKSHCICCDLYNGGGVSDRLLPRLATAREVEALCECYVVAGDYSWTYIKTHEGDLCGPYFVKRGIDYGKR